jgi:hypothetical protein
LLPEELPLDLPELLVERLLRAGSDLREELLCRLTLDCLSRELPGALSLPGRASGLTAGLRDGRSFPGFTAGLVVPGFVAGRSTFPLPPGLPVGRLTF